MFWDVETCERGREEEEGGLKREVLVGKLFVVPLKLVIYCLHAISAQLAVRTEV